MAQLQICQPLDRHAAVVHGRAARDAFGKAAALPHSTATVGQAGADRVQAVLVVQHAGRRGGDQGQILRPSFMQPGRALGGDGEMAVPQMDGFMEDQQADVRKGAVRRLGPVVAVQTGGDDLCVGHVAAEGYGARALVREHQGRRLGRCAEPMAEEVDGRVEGVQRGCPHLRRQAGRHDRGPAHALFDPGDGTDIDIAADVVRGPQGPGLGRVEGELQRIVRTGQGRGEEQIAVAHAGHGDIAAPFFGGVWLQQQGEPIEGVAGAFNCVAAQPGVPCRGVPCRGGPVVARHTGVLKPEPGGRRRQAYARAQSVCGWLQRDGLRLC